MAVRAVEIFVIIIVPIVSKAVDGVNTEEAGEVGSVVIHPLSGLLGIDPVGVVPVAQPR